MTARWPSQAEIARLRVAVAAMPEPRRSAYLFSARDGLDYLEIATRLGLEVPQVQRCLADALVELTAARDDDGDAPRLPR
jgi:DNA-directed RNA polymerase specialized sigma24 family protein